MNVHVSVYLAFVAWHMLGLRSHTCASVSTCQIWVDILPIDYAFLAGEKEATEDCARACTWWTCLYVYGVRMLFWGTGCFAFYWCIAFMHFGVWASYMYDPAIFVAVLRWIVGYHLWRGLAWAGWALMQCESRGICDERATNFPIYMYMYMTSWLPF